MAHIFRLCNSKLLDTEPSKADSIAMGEYHRVDPALQAVISLCLNTGKLKVVAVTVFLTAVIAVVDWWVGNSVSLGVLYVLPMMLGAVVLGSGELAALALSCSLLRSFFDTPGSHLEVLLRFVFASVAYFSSGLFVVGLVRNRELVVHHLDRIQREQSLRFEAEEQLRILIESSPAAILTLDSSGTVLAANNAANAMFAVAETGTLVRRDIAKYLPVLSDAVRFQIGPEAFRTAAQCQGRRENGEIFQAHTWFSSYASPEGARLAAIVVDSSEEMRDREEQNLRELLAYNRIAAGALSHEVRNFCGAILHLSSNLNNRRGLAADHDYQGLINLLQGLEKIASLNLLSQANEVLEEVPLQTVLDNLRIVVESEWRDAGGAVTWPFEGAAPTVLADPHGLLQAFLNLVQNSYRAVQECQTKELQVSVTVAEGYASVRFQDSGPGVSAPERLFEPFQTGTDGAGLGLHISRAIVRSYGGELRFEPAPSGSCFVVKLQVV